MVVYVLKYTAYKRRKSQIYIFSHLEPFRYHLGYQKNFKHFINKCNEIYVLDTPSVKLIKVQYNFVFRTEKKMNKLLFLAPTSFVVQKNLI